MIDLRDPYRQHLFQPLVNRARVEDGAHVGRRRLHNLRPQRHRAKHIGNIAALLLELFKHGARLRGGLFGIQGSDAWHERFLLWYSASLTWKETSSLIPVYNMRARRRLA